MSLIYCCSARVSSVLIQFTFVQFSLINQFWNSFQSALLTVMTKNTKYMFFGSWKYFEIRLKKCINNIQDQYFVRVDFFVFVENLHIHSQTGFPDNMLILSALNKSDFFLKCLSQVDDTGSYIVVDGRGVNRIKRCIICFGELQCRHSHLILFTSLSIYTFKEQKWRLCCKTYRSRQHFQ